MGILGNNPFVALGNPGTGYQIEQSLRFNSADSTKLSRSPSVAGNQRQFTISFWVKNTTTTIGNVFVQARTNLRLNTTNAAFILNAGYGGTNRFFTSNASLRDPSAWYHFVLAFDTTQATETDRVKIWVNNQLQTYSSASYPPQNQDLDFNTTEVFYIGAENTSEYLNGYLAEFYAIDGSVLAPTDFGEPDNNGVWRPKAFIPPADRAQFPATNVVYRDGWSASALNPYYSFDGLLWRGTAVNGATNATWSGSIDTSGATTVRILTAFGANSGQVGGAGDLVKVNNTDISGKMKTANAYLTLTWIDITTEAGNAITGLYMNAISGVSNPSIAAIDIDGVVVVDELSGYGENGAYLTFNPGATNGIGHDHSGNGNNLSPTGFTTSGTGTDVMSDTPTTNWCTLDPLTNGSYATLSDGNLSAYGNNSSDNGNSRTNFAVTTGKWYCEFTCVASTGGYPQLGIMRQYDASRPNNGSPQSGYSSGMLYPTQSCSYWPNGQLSINSVDTLNWGSTWTAGDTIAIALDGDNGAVYFAKNNTWQNSGDPTSGSSKTGAALTWTDVRDYVFTIASYNGSDIDANFGQRDFAYTPPTGFKALNTANLPAPDIKDGSQYFDTLTWTGDSSGASRTLSGLAFGPDLVWAKGRNQAISHQLTDIVRGAGATSLRSDDTRVEGADGTSSGYLSAFTTDGFETTSSSTNVYYNTNTYTYAAWCWEAGGSVSADNNTAGSITSTVSANPTAGFSIVTYTGTGSAATVGHGLGVPPAFMVVKCRNKTFGWTIYHQSLGNTRHLDFTDGTGFTGDAWNSTNPTSTVFSIGTDAGSNNGSSPPNNYVAYCYAEVESYSKIGSFVGNASADGPFVFCGFRPAYVWLKGSTFTSNWNAYDSARSEYNATDDLLRLNLAAAEVPDYSIAAIDLLSNGFKIRTSSGDWNSSGQTFVFCAFAEHPFGGFRTTPATAR